MGIVENVKFAVGLLAAGGEWMTAAAGLQEWYRKPWYRNPVAWNASNLLILC